MTKARNKEFDLLRMVMILSAVAIHYNSKIGLGALAVPSVLVQRYIFTIGAFFFFTAGFMTYRIYLQKFVNHRLKTSVHIIKKGAFILLLYFGYIVLIHLFTNTPFPQRPADYVIRHDFFAKVLFTFGVLYLITPVILLLAVSIKKWTLLLLLVVCAVFVAYSPEWRIRPYSHLIFDRSAFLYPLLPSLIVYSVGFIMAYFDKRISVKFDKQFLALLSLALLLTHIILLLIPPYTRFFKNLTVFTFLESFTPYLAVLIMRYILSLAWIARIFDRPALLCIGIKSLTFYVISNVFLSLLLIPEGSSALLRTSMFLLIIAAAYLFTYWHYNSDRYFKLAGR